VINPGVEIGDHTIIGSGSVVTHDIPENVIAAGNPCQVIREIGETDRAYWKKQYELYRQAH
jgi:maltose O-acetyltransferase